MMHLQRKEGLLCWISSHNSWLLLLFLWHVRMKCRDHWAVMNGSVPISCVPAKNDCAALVAVFWLFCFSVLIFQGIFFLLGHTWQLLRTCSWICTQWLLLAGLRDSLGCLGVELPRKPHAKQMPDRQYYHTIFQGLCLFLLRFSNMLIWYPAIDSLAWGRFHGKTSVSKEWGLSSTPSPK